RIRAMPFFPDIGVIIIGVRREGRSPWPVEQVACRDVTRLLPQLGHSRLRERRRDRRMNIDAAGADAKRHDNARPTRPCRRHGSWPQGTKGMTSVRPPDNVDRLKGSFSLNTTRHPSRVCPTSRRPTVDCRVCTRTPTPYDVWKWLKSRSEARG